MIKSSKIDYKMMLYHMLSGIFISDQNEGVIWVFYYTSDDKSDYQFNYLWCSSNNSIKIKITIRLTQIHHTQPIDISGALCNDIC